MNHRIPFSRRFPAALAGVALGLGASPALADTAVTPGQIATAWSWEPGTIALLLLSALLYLRGVHALWRHAGRGRGVGIAHVAAFLGGLLAIFVALISPLDALSLTLLSAHMVQHLLLMLAAAPLLAAGRPLAAFLWALPLEWRRRVGHGWRAAGIPRHLWRVVSHPAAALALLVAALWSWHAPVLYQAALTSDAIHALEHASFLVASFLFWWAVLHADEPGGMGHGIGVIYLFVAGMQSTLLGVLFTFSQTLWYPDYAARTALWHLTALQDQQLAGVIMWIPSGLVYLGVTCVLFVRWLSAMDRAQRVDERLPGEIRTLEPVSGMAGKEAEIESRLLHARSS